eukprot:TRINITY_DN1635_c0_g1_i10.p8 TRINITY_DN1635_c0_g1~~TRINITY_DN1635_c0_g1_i10.p8  ORF type:complete len:129 (+),score=7.14 TRINITY_DN1635_c0_g1_i10:2775-3161(+)
MCKYYSNYSQLRVINVYKSNRGVEKSYYIALLFFQLFMEGVYVYRNCMDMFNIDIINIVWFIIYPYFWLMCKQIIKLKKKKNKKKKKKQNKEKEKKRCEKTEKGEIRSQGISLSTQRQGESLLDSTFS